MKASLAVCFLAMAAVALARPGDDLYDDKYDGIDLKQFEDNPRLIEPYFKCLMGEGSCTAEGKHLKKHLPDALETGCANCTEAQKKGARTMMSFLINKEPEKWEKLCAKFDPEGKYRTKYEKELKEVSS